MNCGDLVYPAEADEIRLCADYVGSKKTSRYLVDDRGERGGFTGEHFVITGDQNTDPFDGNSIDQAIAQLLESAFPCLLR